MEKKKLLLFPFFVGLVLMAYSWYISYPLSITSIDDVIFNHVPVLYWISLSLLLISMGMMALSFKNYYFKWMLAVCCVIALYSLFYFYYRLPTSDANFFRALTENFITTKNIDPTQANSYYQWPSFFILAKIVNLVSGLEQATFEFMLFTIIGFLLSSALYVYFSKAYTHGGFLAVLTFFISMFSFLNYQAVPFSLALSLLFLLFILETQKKSSSVILAILVLYISISITHAFVPLFFVLYLLIRTIVSKSKTHLNLFILTLIIYFLVQLSLAQFHFPLTIKLIMTVATTEYSKIISHTTASVTYATDALAQVFSRTVTVTFLMISFAGFVFIIIKRKIREVDTAIFITGLFYSGVGVVAFTLGSRGLPIFFIPISLGIIYLYESRFRHYVKIIFLVLLALSVFIPIHNSFFDSQIQFQTNEAYHAENFILNNYNWTNPSLVLSHVRVEIYLKSKQSGIANFENDVYDPLFPRLNEYDIIIYTVGLGKNLLRYNYTTERIFREQKFNLIYNNGFSYIATKSSNFTWAPTR